MSSGRLGTEEITLPSALLSTIIGCFAVNVFTLSLSGDVADKKQSFIVLRKNSLLGCRNICVRDALTLSLSLKDLLFCTRDADMVDG